MRFSMTSDGIAIGGDLFRLGHNFISSLRARTLSRARPQARGLGASGSTWIGAPSAPPTKTSFARSATPISGPFCFCPAAGRTSTSPSIPSCVSTSATTSASRRLPSGKSVKSSFSKKWTVPKSSRAAISGQNNSRKSRKNAGRNSLKSWSCPIQAVPPYLIQTRKGWSDLPASDKNRRNSFAQSQCTGPSHPEPGVTGNGTRNQPTSRALPFVLAFAPRP